MSDETEPGGLDAPASLDPRVIEIQYRFMRSELRRLNDAVSKVSDALGKLVRLEEQHIQTRTDVGEVAVDVQKHEQRLQTIEREMPGLKEMRRWVIGGILAGVGLMGAAVVKLVLIDKPATVQVLQENKK